MGGKRDCPSDQTTVVAPVKAEPRTILPELILKVSRFVELLIVIDAKHSGGRGRSGSRSAQLGKEKSRRHARHHYQGGEAVEIWNAYTSRIAGDLRPLPPDRKEDWGIPKHGKVVSVVRVLGDVLA